MPLIQGQFLPQYEQAVQTSSAGKSLQLRMIEEKYGSQAPAYTINTGAVAPMGGHVPQTTAGAAPPLDPRLSQTADYKPGYGNYGFSPGAIVPERPEGFGSTYTPYVEPPGGPRSYKTQYLDDPTYGRREWWKKNYPDTTTSWIDRLKATSTSPMVGSSISWLYHLASLS